MKDIVIYSIADFLRFRQIILSYAETGSKIGMETLRETEEALQRLFDIPKGINPESMRTFIPSEMRLLMVYLESICSLIREIKEIFHIKGLKPGQVSKLVTKKKKRRKRRKN